MTPRLNDFNSEAEHYDLFEVKNQPVYDRILDFLESLFRENGVQAVLDATCGTGAQAIPLAKRGFDVLGSDIAPDLLRVARRKAEGTTRVKFMLGDVRRSSYGTFDAAIAILNSLGYLDRADFGKALSNINSNLRPDGLLVFDNTNRGWLDAGNFTTDRAIDTAGQIGTIKFIRFSRSDYDANTGIMTTKWRTLVQDGFSPMTERRGVWRRQTYTVAELQGLLDEKGFDLIGITDRNGGSFDESRSTSYLIVARRT